MDVCQPLSNFLDRLMRAVKFLLPLLLFPLFLSVPALARNQVLVLDGDSSYVRLPSSVFDGLEEATVEAWVKREAWAFVSQGFSFGADNQWSSRGVNNWESYSLLQCFI